MSMANAIKSSFLTLSLREARNGSKSEQPEPGITTALASAHGQPI